MAHDDARFDAVRRRRTQLQQRPKAQKPLPKPTNRRQPGRPSVEKQKEIVSGLERGARDWAEGAAAASGVNKQWFAGLPLVQPPTPPTYMNRPTVSNLNQAREQGIVQRDDRQYVMPDYPTQQPTAAGGGFMINPGIYEQVARGMFPQRPGQQQGAFATPPNQRGPQQPFGEMLSNALSLARPGMTIPPSTQAAPQPTGTVGLPARGGMPAPAAATQAPGSLLGGEYVPSAMGIVGAQPPAPTMRGGAPIYQPTILKETPYRSPTDRGMYNTPPEPYGGPVEAGAYNTPPTPEQPYGGPAERGTYNEPPTTLASVPWERLGFGDREEGLTWARGYREQTGRWPWEGPGSREENLGMALAAYGQQEQPAAAQEGALPPGMSEELLASLMGSYGGGGGGGGFGGGYGGWSGGGGYGGGGGGYSNRGYQGYAWPWQPRGI